MGDFRVFISYGAEPIENSNNIRELYFVQKLEGDRETGKVIQENSFQALKKALDFVGERYPHYKFKDLSQTGGCGSCSNA